MTPQAPAGLPEGRPRPPDLRDGSRFVCLDRVPIVDTFERTVTRYDAAGEPYKVKERLDDDQIRTILANTQKRDRAGDHGPVFLGHTNDDRPEADQPPIVGYLTNYELGEHNGRTAILASMCLDRLACSEVTVNGKAATPELITQQFPRRSGEIVAMEKPHGFIDSIAVLKRTPQRPLGLVSHLNHSADISRFMCPECEREAMPSAGPNDASRALIKRTMALLSGLIDTVAPGSGDEAAAAPAQEAAPAAPAPAPAPTPAAPPAEAPPPAPEAESSTPKAGDEEPEDETDRFCATCGSRFHTTENHDLHHPDGPRESNASGENREVEREKSRLAAAGNTAGLPSDTSVSTPNFNQDDEESRRMALAEEDVTRMSLDQANIEITRLRSQNEEFQRSQAALKDRLDESDRKARLASIETKVVQLEAEDYELDRPAEVERLSLIADDQIDGEISRMRKFYKQSPRRGNPAGAPMLNIGGDLGGNTLPRSARTLAELLTPPPEDAVEGTNDVRIFGESVARMAMEEEESGRPLIAANATRGLRDPSDKRHSPLRYARAAVRRFQNAESVTRTG